MLALSLFVESVKNCSHPHYDVTGPFFKKKKIAMTCCPRPIVGVLLRAKVSAANKMVYEFPCQIKSIRFFPFWYLSYTCSVIFILTRLSAQYRGYLTTIYELL